MKTIILVKSKQLEQDLEFSSRTEFTKQIHSLMGQGLVEFQVYTTDKKVIAKTIKIKKLN